VKVYFTKAKIKARYGENGCKTQLIHDKTESINQGRKQRQ